jgi:hypothetical protein
MERHVVGIVRSATGLEELVYESHGEAPSHRPWSVGHVCVRRPLPRSSHADLREAWLALAAVVEWDERTLDRVLKVLCETVPAGEGSTWLPPLAGAVRQARVPRATAAHPRAYRGTRYKPPSPPQPRAVDARPYLLDWRHVDELLVLLGADPGSDPYVRSRFGVTGRSLDPWFVGSLLPLFDRCSWREVAAFQAIGRALDLDGDVRLRATLVGVFVTAGDPERALGWWSYILAQAPVTRLEMAQIIAGSGVTAVDAVGAEVASEIAALEPAQQWSFLRGLARGASPAYLGSGLRLRAFPREKVIEPPPGSADVAGAINETIERLGQAMEEDSGPEFWRTFLWQLCGEQPGLLDLLQSPAVESLVPRAAFWLLRVVAAPHWLPDIEEQRWAELDRSLHAVAEAAVRLPGEYQHKFIADWADIFWGVIEDRTDLAAVVGVGIGLSLRVARPPFSANPVLGPVLARLAAVKWKNAGRLDQLRAAPDASWVALERACRRENDAWLAGRGLARLARQTPGLLIAAFSRNPKALVRTAKTLAGVSAELAEQILSGYAASPLANGDIAGMPIEDLAELADSIARAGGPNPIRRALREHLAGRRDLTIRQISSHRGRVIADLDLVRLAAIRQAVERHLGSRVGLQRIETPEAWHALLMLDGADVNRRQLRRLITGTIDGDPQRRLRHPLTQAWLARHPQLDLGTWLAGIQLHRHVDRIGTVQLAIETDPLEALKLGTYAGSCLGRGGGLSYSAAAIVLDINKNVVYARNQLGAVIGRQLIAVSEADELVCFHVYASHPEQMQPLFREFDRALAAQLRMAIFDPSTAASEYEIASILSHDWWDDGAWDPATDESFASDPASSPCSRLDTG